MCLSRTSKEWMSFQRMRMFEVCSEGTRLYGMRLWCWLAVRWRQGCVMLRHLRCVMR